MLNGKDVLKDMFIKFYNVVQRWIRSKGEGKNSPSLITTSVEKKLANPHNIVDIYATEFVDTETIDLLNRSRIQWQLGEWENLAKLDLEKFSSRRDREEATWLITAAMFQLGNIARAQELCLNAMNDGYNKKELCDILICGVYNNLARARLLSKNNSVSLTNFKKSVDRGASSPDSWGVIEGRIQTQQRQVDLLLKKVVEKEFEEIAGLNERYLEFKSAGYWEQRYKKGGTSGFGSYGRLAEFKARVINQFVKEKDVQKLIEFGCGDGNQLAKIAVSKYLGIDVSPTIIQHCRTIFQDDASKRFLTVAEFLAEKEKAELTLSLDVIFHLVEDQVFEAYMKDLFDSSARYCIVYSCDSRDTSTDAQHVRQRTFTTWVTLERPNWRLIDVIPNEFPHDGTRNPKDTSFSDFFIYEKF